MWTMQAPHKPAPQPNFVPVSFNPSRITHSNGVSGGASVVAGCPFTTKFVDIDSSWNPQLAPKTVLGLSNHAAETKEWQRPQRPAKLYFSSPRVKVVRGHALCVHLAFSNRAPGLARNQHLLNCAAAHPECDGGRRDKAGGRASSGSDSLVTSATPSRARARA